MDRFISTVFARATDAPASAVLEELRVPTLSQWEREHPDLKPRQREDRFPTPWKACDRFFLSKITVKNATLQLMRIEATYDPALVLRDADVRLESAVYVVSGDVRPQSFRVHDNTLSIDGFPRSVVIAYDSNQVEVFNAAIRLIRTFMRRSPAAATREEAQVLMEHVRSFEGERRRYALVAVKENPDLVRMPAGEMGEE